MEKGLYYWTGYGIDIWCSEDFLVADFGIESKNTLNFPLESWCMPDKPFLLQTVFTILGRRVGAVRD